MVARREPALPYETDQIRIRYFSFGLLVSDGCRKSNRRAIEALHPKGTRAWDDGISANRDRATAFEEA